MKNLFSFLIIASIVTACTAKRPETFSQGQGTNLDAIATWKERMIPITTLGVIGKASTTRAQDNVSVNDKNMNHFDLVKIKIEDAKLQGLVGTPPFHGRDNTTGVYQLKVKLTENYLKFYKVAKPEDLPFEEHVYKEETLADGRITIPMLGYRINGYYHIEPVKTSDDQNSHHLTEIADVDHSKSTHVRIDWSSREYFAPVKTTDLMPAEIFFKKVGNDYKPYEWYYAETVIQKSLSDTETKVGENGIRTENSQLVPASKVMFIPRENELRVVDVARDERLTRDQIQNSGDLNSNAALIIPVKWTEHRTKSDGTNLSLQGEEVTERKWNQRGAFEMNIPELKSAGITDGTTRLLDLQVDDNYFSFTVLNMIGNQGRKIHYSFLRADQGRIPYAPRPSFKSDRNLFGFFTSVKPFIPNWEYYTEQDYSKRNYMSRMNPDSKVIEFHLSADSPKDLEDVAERAVNAWDQTFEEAMKGSGKSLKIRFNKTRVQLGDLRYNVIHLVDTLNEDGLLGFGPSVADPESGEIVSATTNVYVNSTRAIAVSTIRQYMIDRLEKRLSKNSKDETVVQAEDEVLATQLNPSSKKFAAKVAEAMKTVKKKNGELAPFSKEEFLKDLKSHQACRYAEESMMSANDRDIQKYCPEVEKLLTKYEVDSLDVSSRGSSKGNWERVWAESKSAIGECSGKLARGKLLSTLIHEVGHNLGLRHNFYASYDKDNFKKSTTIFGDEITAHSSSIMEYTDWDEDRLTVTGSYDIAAIRFGYGEQVEMKDGSIAKVDASKPVDAKNLKPYLFCTDEEAYTGLNALCKPHDAGTTPLELVKFYIKGYKRSETLRKLRRARPINGQMDYIAASNLQRTFLPLKDIYNEWRYKLGEYVRKSNRYLTDYNTESYKKVLTAMAADPEYGPIFNQYFEAAETIYSFLKDVAFGPNEYCLIDDQGEKRVIELERLRDQLSESTRGAVMIRSCADAVENEAAIQLLAKVLGAKAPKLLEQTGYPVNSYRFEKAATIDDYLSDNGELFDVVGNSTTRYAANMIIHERLSDYRVEYRNILSEFAPNMTDEPHHYVDYLVTLNNRLVDGVDLSQYGIKDVPVQPLFEQEGKLLKQFAIEAYNGLYTPGEKLNSLNRVATSRKLAPLFVYMPAKSEDPKSFAATLALNNQKAYYAAQSKDDFFAYTLINKYNEVTDLVAYTPSAIYSAIMELVPKASDLPKLTIEDFASIISVLGKMEETFPDYATCVESGSPALDQLNLIIPQMIKDYQAAAAKGEDAAKEFLGKSLVEYTKGVLKEQPLLYTQENMKNLAAGMTACLKDDVAGAKPRMVKRNAKDYEAQRSRILDVLSAYAN